MPSCRALFGLLSGGGGIRTPDRRTGQRLSRPPHSSTLPPLQCGCPSLAARCCAISLRRHAQRVAELDRRPALLAGRGREAPHPRGVDPGRQAGGGSRPCHPHRRRGALLHRGRSHRRSDAPNRGAQAGPRRRHLLRPGQGRGGNHAARPQRGALGAGVGDGEPRRHRPADAGGGDLDRDPRHRRRAPKPLSPGRGARAGARRRSVLEVSERPTPRRTGRPGLAWGRSGSSPRSRFALSPPSPCTAWTRRTRSSETLAGLDELANATTTSSSSSSPIPTRR